LNLKGDDPLIKVLHKAFDILENMSAHKDRAFSLTELAEMIGEKPTTCANIVKTLCDRGYLCRTEPRGYTLGPVAQGLNYVDLADTKLVESSREPMTRLVQKYGASGVLAVLRRGKKKILDDFDPASYSKSVFDMYAGDRVRVEIESSESFVGNMFDRFGMDIVLRKSAVNSFVFSSEVSLSPSFFAWLSTFEGEVRLISPDTAVEAFAQHVEKIKNSLRGQK
jgi:hypothetical protein